MANNIDRKTGAQHDNAKVMVRFKNLAQAGL